MHRLQLAALILIAPLTLFAQTPDPFLKDAILAADATVRPKVKVKQMPPVSSLSATEEGQLRIEFIVERNGSVKDARVVARTSAPRQFEAQALADMRRWKFQPGEKDGQPVRVVASFNVAFVRGPLPGRGELRDGILSKVSLDGVDDDFAAGVLRMSDRPAGVTWPAVRKEVKPDFGIIENLTQASIELDIVVLPTGKVGPIQITRSDSERLNDAAVACARQWEFSPAMKDGKPVAVVVELMFEYRKH